MKLAEALLLRKQLEAEVKRLEPLKLQWSNGAFETKIIRRPLSDTVDEATVTMPKISFEEFTREYSKKATQLRKLDTAIQKANWAHDVDFNEESTDQSANTEWSWTTEVIK